MKEKAIRKIRAEVFKNSITGKAGKRKIKEIEKLKAENKKLREENESLKKEFGDSKDQIDYRKEMYNEM